jgi:hemolysin III
LRLPRAPVSAGNAGFLLRGSPIDRPLAFVSATKSANILSIPVGRNQPVPHRRADKTADNIVQVASLIFASGACVALGMLARLQPDALHLASLALYAIGLIAMFGCSALYNLTDGEFWKRVFRRFDHAAIFLMIAGTYTPFALISIGGTRGHALLAFVWSVALAGAAAKLFSLPRFERFSIVAYLLLGWIILVVLVPLYRAVPFPAFILLAAGGLLYSFGVIFHLWSRLHFQNAIWHLFVLAGAGCHFAAILSSIALT